MVGTVVVSLVLAAMFALAVRSIYKNKKAGNCCGGCSGCSGSCSMSSTGGACNCSKMPMN